MYSTVLCPVKNSPCSPDVLVAKCVAEVFYSWLTLLTDFSSYFVYTSMKEMMKYRVSITKLALCDDPQLSSM